MDWRDNDKLKLQPCIQSSTIGAAHIDGVERMIACGAGSRLSKIIAKLFFFRCRNCGAYPVTEHTARRFLTEKLNIQLDEAFQKGAERAVLSFDNGCPKCKPDNPNAVVELSVLKGTSPRRDQLH